jgi:hypothetical protein
MEPKGSLMCSQGPATGLFPEPNPRPCVTSFNKLIFYSEELLAPHPTLKLEDHPLLAVHDAYSIYLQLPSTYGGHLLHLQPEDAPHHGDRDPHNMILCSRVK